ncbi:hypothetical protein Trydic_g6860 [Trypoxylus dichotomus]
MERVAGNKWRWGGYLAGQEWSKMEKSWRPRLHKRNIGRPLRRWIDDTREKVGKNFLLVAQDRISSRCIEVGTGIFVSRGLYNLGNKVIRLISKTTALPARISPRIKRLYGVREPQQQEGRRRISVEFPAAFNGRRLREEEFN